MEETDDERRKSYNYRLLNVTLRRLLTHAIVIQKKGEKYYASDHFMNEICAALRYLRMPQVFCLLNLDERQRLLFADSFLTLLTGLEGLPLRSIVEKSECTAKLNREEDQLYNNTSGCHESAGGSNELMEISNSSNIVDSIGETIKMEEMIKEEPLGVHEDTVPSTIFDSQNGTERKIKEEEIDEDSHDLEEKPGTSKDSEIKKRKIKVRIVPDKKDGPTLLSAAVKRAKQRNESANLTTTSSSVDPVRKPISLLTIPDTVNSLFDDTRNEVASTEMVNCPDCTVPVRECDLKQHIINHKFGRGVRVVRVPDEEQKKGFRCTEMACDYKCTTIEKRKQHKEVIHNEDYTEWFKNGGRLRLQPGSLCPCCPVHVSDLINLNQHMIRCHPFRPVQAVFSCNSCHMRFPRLHLIYAHWHAVPDCVSSIRIISDSPSIANAAKIAKVMRTTPY